MLSFECFCCVFLSIEKKHGIHFLLESGLPRPHLKQVIPRRNNYGICNLSLRDVLTKRT
jgi:hypothetical protein